MKQPMHRSEFVRQLKAAIPEAVAALRGYRDNLTMEMLAFTVLTQEAIDGGDFQLVGRCFRFADQVLAQGNRQVRNSIAVSFLEDLSFSGPNGARAERLLTPALKAERDAVLGRG